MLNRTILDRLARLRAAIEERGERDAVLAEEGVSVETWLAWQREVLAAGPGLFDLADEYCKAFEAPFEMAQPTPSAPSPTSVSAAVSAPAPLSSSGPASTPAPLSSSAPGSTPVPESTARPAEPDPVRQVPSFMRFGPSVLRGPSGVATPLATPPAAPAELSPPAVLGSHTIADEGTADVRQVTAELRIPPTPFRALDPRANGVSLQKLAELRVALANSQESAGSTLASLGLSVEAYTQAEAYWSAQMSSDEAIRLEFARLSLQVSKTPAAPASSPGVLPQEGRGEGTGTVELNSVHIAEARLMRLSSSASGSSALPALSVEQYAWVYATLRGAREGGRAEALARLRLTESQYQALEQQWKAAMSTNPPLKQAFILALAKHTGAPP